MRYTVVPVGQESKALLMDNFGLEKYHINGEVESGTVQIGRRILPMWFYLLEDIEEEIMRRKNIEHYAKLHYISEKEAIDYFSKNLCGVQRNLAIISPLPPRQKVGGFR